MWDSTAPLGPQPEPVSSVFFYIYPYAIFFHCPLNLNKYVDQQGPENDSLVTATVNISIVVPTKCSLLLEAVIDNVC